MTNKAIKSWQEHEFSSGPCTGEDYLTFQKAMQSDLKKQLKSVGLTLRACLVSLPQWKKAMSLT